MNSLRISALAGFLALTALASAPAFAQSNASQIPDLRGTEFDYPSVTVYDWGVIESPADGPQIQYSWAEVNRRLNRARAVPAPGSAQSAGISATERPNLRGTEFDQPDMIVYSWGVLHAPVEGQQVQYFWSDVNRRLAAARAPR